ncbi:aminotransferase class I/II-fold pyridoxal phosphate-dependent enzyme [Jeotgalibacillus sp. ET6]|uniref:aminotransferase class I/II-fold pyridoxal phosphate-dependent enzyme n=1 Tax=Jeotgalibacillus sp. ET6 TaxID=3037260 RepID=UPI0024181D64|nr:aminotransferase class I/II-fold pyridoxal phosphate-dependent enzyme [Jeotgalibacillus sp. ET6]MDG5473852.1 aminotransferase class I/II-fold pyridoxal phosphate-dependent enzyme [Jeotgalibacillus sp. ET6]
MNQKKMPLIEALHRFKKKKPVSFHVPGHKNGRIDPGDLFSAAGRFDATELSTLDDLHAPDGVIKEAMELLRSHYRSMSSYFLVNGSTVGNLTMLLAACEAEDTVFIASNSHKSILHACSLSKVKPVFLEPEVDSVTLTPKGISQEVLSEALQRHPEAKALVMTYPSYYGHTSDLEGLISLAKKKQLMVLVDEAHGAHFTAGSPFPSSSLAAGADMVVHSAHKTLPALTMGSFLHIGTNRIDRLKVERALGMLQSSSPSYLIMASLDGARSYLAGYGPRDLDHFSNERKNFISSLQKLPYITVIEPDDPLKLILRASGMTGYELQQILEEQGIFPELADPLQVLLILPLLKEGMFYSEEFDRTIEALKGALDQQADSLLPPSMITSPENRVKELAMSVAEAELAPFEWIPFHASCGRIAAASIIPYPPGVPFVIAGEKLTEKKIDQLINWSSTDMRFQGEQRVKEKEMKVVKDCEERNE